MTARATYPFAGKTILITGGAGDIGQATARRFAADGAAVVLLDLNEVKLAEVKCELEANQIPVATFCCDVTSPLDVANAFAGAIERFKRLDYVFNNAGYQGLFVRTDEYPEDDFEKVININVTGVYRVLKVAAQHMRTVGGGSIVNMASYAGVIGPPNMLAYSASKFAVIGITKTAAKDLAPYQIRVNALSPSLIGPGSLWTRQTKLQAGAQSQYYDTDPKVVEQQMLSSVPMRRLGSLAEVANGVAFLMSDEACYITGFNLEITGGQ
ncbi:MAG: SDR family oxidoreductase [Chroococcidiopsidaceae cyanobacterium CP_BM_ER_R8_30]|nr:SDR family oxidoreductase [Chroococcidiopsidaceae cyanobacterium CP_BM_ER_R8_30]